MSILFPQATPNQIELLKLLNIPSKPYKLITHHEMLLFNQINENMLNRVRTRIKIASEKEVSGYILAAESAITYRKHVYEQPKFKMDALELLKNLCGHTHSLLTAWGLKNVKTGKVYTDTSETKVVFREIDPETLTNYVNDHDVISFIGGYDPLHSQATSFIEKIDGSLSNFLYHLPLDQILPIFHQEKI